MGQSPSWKADSISVSEEIPLSLWNSKVHYRVCKSQPLDHSPKRTIQLTTYRLVFISSILIVSSLLCLDLPNGIFYSGF
jgi:hypothetical protein